MRLDLIKPYTREIVLNLTRQRSGELKIGETIQTVTENWQQDLENNSAKFVVVGIAEDMGVRANYGRAGAATAFRPALESFLNQQSNGFMNPAAVCVLGELHVDDLMEKASQLDVKNKNEMSHLRELVAALDERVSQIVRYLIGLKKIPIIIGGGHNNSFGNIQGASLALNKKINVINCDPHLDFRALEGRHSGNGFSYAYAEGLINRYAVLAMHEQYNNQDSLQKFKEQPEHLFYTSYESVFVREELNYKTALQHCMGFVKNEACGIEIDLDAITNVPSSAKTSSGISPTQARQYVHQCARQLEVLYLHIAEGAPVLSHIKADNKTGKLIAYLVSDFIKACENT